MKPKSNKKNTMVKVSMATLALTMGVGQVMMNQQPGSPVYAASEQQSQSTKLIDLNTKWSYLDNNTDPKKVMIIKHGQKMDMMFLLGKALQGSSVLKMVNLEI